MSVGRGEPWGGPAHAPPDAEVDGSDAELAAFAVRRPRTRVSFRPTAESDLARAIGIAGGLRGIAARSKSPLAPGDPLRPPASVEVPIDGLELDVEPDMGLNAVVLGTPPDQLRWWSPSRPVAVSVDGRERFRGRATTVLVMSGQYLRGADVAPRGHPGDGRVEIQVYALARGERKAMRRRLAQGVHVPHPRIREVAGRRIDVATGGKELRLEIDGVRRGRRRELTLEVVPGVLRILV